METTTDKTRRLILALEGIAIVTALVLILVDYKLKNDLVDLYKKMEKALADGQRILSADFGAGIDLGSVRSGNMVRTATPMETTTVSDLGDSNGKPPAATGKPNPANRARRDRNNPVPKPDKPLRS